MKFNLYLLPDAPELTGLFRRSSWQLNRDMAMSAQGNSCRGWKLTSARALWGCYHWPIAPGSVSCGVKPLSTLQLLSTWAACSPSTVQRVLGVGRWRDNILCLIAVFTFSSFFCLPALSMWLLPGKWLNSNHHCLGQHTMRLRC